MQPAAPPTKFVTDLELVRARTMAASLSRLLDQVRGARDVLPHLAALEAALVQRGLVVLDDASITVLSRISTQLASLPVADDDAPLQDLQMRLLAALDRRSRPKQRVVSSFMGDGRMSVEEVSHSAFLAATKESGDTVPAYFKSRDAAGGGAAG
jgi:hypothetical protein